MQNLDDALDRAMNILLQWREGWENGAERVLEIAQATRDTYVRDLDDVLHDLEVEAENLRDNVPCEDGIAEFIRDLPVADPENMVPRDEVALDAEEARDLQACLRAGFIPLEHVRSFVYELVAETSLLHQALGEIHSDLLDGSFDPSNRLNDRIGQHRVSSRQETAGPTYP